MSIILKGIDMPKDAEYFSVTFYKKGAYRKEKIMDISEAIQIPKNHGRLIDGDELVKHLRKDPLFDLVERYGISGVIESRPTILEAEE